jgi:excisionase family DNA binding protein
LKSDRRSPSAALKLRAGRWLSATQVARTCGVDLKTIHNWVDQDKLPAERTTGRHLRFWPLDVAAFLGAYELGVPEGLRQVRLRVVAIDADAGRLAATRRALARRFDVTTAEHVVAGIAAVAQLAPDVAVVGDVRPLDATVLRDRLAAVAGLRHVRVVQVIDASVIRDAIEALAGGEAPR